MRYEKCLLFICLIICLFSIASVCASEVNETLVTNQNQSEEISIYENQDMNEGIAQSEALGEHVDLNMVDKINNNKISTGNSNKNEVLSSEFFESGSDGYIESNDMLIIYNSPNKFKIKLVGDSVSNQNVYFSVYDSDNFGENIGKFVSKSDSNGYATLNENLEWGHYWINVASDNHGSVYNSLTVRPNGYKHVYLTASNAKYKDKYNYIECTWYGIFTGYLKVYKGNKLVKKVSLKSRYSNDDEAGFTWIDGHSINTKKYSVGKYTVKVVDKNGKVVAKKSFKIFIKSKKKTIKKKVTKKKSKKKTTKKKTKKHSKSKTLTLNAKYKWVTKKKGKYTVKARLWRVFSGIMGYYNDVDIILYKNGIKQKSSKYLSNYKYKEKGKWKWQKWRHGKVDHAYHRYMTFSPVSKIKVKW